MRIINSLRSYILEEEFKITILKNRINIVNYTDIGLIDNNIVTIYHEDNKITIKGNNLTVTRLMNDEILINGIINSLEFR